VLDCRRLRELAKVAMDNAEEVGRYLRVGIPLKFNANVIVRGLAQRSGVPVSKRTANTTKACDNHGYRSRNNEARPAVSRCLRRIRITRQEDSEMKRLTAFVLVCGFLVAPAVSAEPAAESAKTAPGIRQSIAHVRFEGNPRHGSVTPAYAPRTNVGTAQKATSAVALGFIGALGGAWLGAKMDSNCACDDPGMRGAVIGMPIGAALGGIIGWRLAH
jgi:hypothetical protein